MYGVGGVREAGVTVVVVSPEGLFLRAIVFFRFGRRPLLIPWGAIESATPGRFRWRPSFLLAIQGGGTVRVGDHAYARMRPHLGFGMAAATAQRQRTILVVEDNEQNMELVGFLLEEAGFRVLGARDALSARIEFRRGQPDLVLMDMHLPGRDGLSLVREFRLDPMGASTPIVALTAHAMRGDRERFLSGGCDGYLSKPIDPSTFVSAVAAYLEARKR